MILVICLVVAYILIGLWFDYMCSVTDPEFVMWSDPWEMFTTLLLWPINLYYCILGWLDGSLLKPK